MRLFGLPYQFTPQVDPRLNGVSSCVGNKYLENILLESPICTIIPGEPKYLPGQSRDRKISTTAALLESASSGFTNLHKYIRETTDDDLRLYDFKRSYVEYMKYVNILCRTGATFLELNDTIDGTYFQQYDWRNYRQDSTKYTSITGQVTKNLQSSIAKGVKSVGNAIFGNKKIKYESNGEDSDDMIYTNHNFVQFVVDPSSGMSTSLSNSTSESMLKSALDSGSNQLKEFAFMANSGGIDTATLQEFTTGVAEGLNSGVETILGNNSVSSALSRIINLGSGVIKGENIIMPDIYQSSSRGNSYSIIVHLVSPYGTKLGYYMDIFVPMMHLLALAIPRQKSANTYGSPFLVKAYIDGALSCNNGIVSDISISPASNSWTVDSLPTAVDVTLSLTDLYSDLTMPPSSSPIMFVNNSSLIEFLATNCGLSIVNPNINLKAKMTVNAITSALSNIPSNINAGITEAVDNEISKFTGLIW